MVQTNSYGSDHFLIVLKIGICFLIHYTVGILVYN